MIILAIESSCDETSIGIIQDDKILCNIISSQIDSHKKFGGVVPELASRLHLSNISTVLREALKVSKINLADINYIAYTAKPGLVGCLHMGKIFAETISLYLEIPLLPENHVYGHIYGARIDNNFAFPALVLLVSGGHTQLIYMPKDLEFKVVGSTLDDAVGECYDKVARILGLEYPGGPVIDRLARKGTPTYELPVAKRDQTFDFSFSGLKSACANLANQMQMKNQTINIQDFCSSFQKAAVDQLMTKVEMGLAAFPEVKTLILAGGVSANSALRERFKELEQNNLTVIIPQMQYCTDNGAMIAQLAYCEIMNRN